MQDHAKARARQVRENELKKRFLFQNKLTEKGHAHRDTLAIDLLRIIMQELRLFQVIINRDSVITIFHVS